MPARTTSVTLAATSADDKRRGGSACRRRIPMPCGFLSAAPACGWLWTKRMAGSRPQSNAQTSDAPMAKSTSGASMRSGCSSGRAEGRAWASKGRASVAKARPSRHPAAESRSGSAIGAAHELRGASAHGGAHGGFVLAAGGAGQQQVGDVDAADEQYSRDGGEQHEQRVAAGAGEVLLQAGEGGGEIGMVRGLTADCVLQRVHLGCGLRIARRRV